MADVDYSGIIPTGVTSDTNIGTVRWEDADTIYKHGQGYRIAGLSADEIQHVTDTGIVPGQWGGEMQTKAVSALANDMGFTNIIETGKETYGRKVAHLQDADGRDFTDALYAEGIISPGTWTSARHQDLAQEGWFARSMQAHLSETRGQSPVKDDEWGLARKEIQRATQASVLRDADGTMTFKGIALNESELAQANKIFGSDYSPYMGNQVQYRHSNRDIEGNARNVFSAGWSQGWSSIKESAYGGLQIMGDILDNDWLYRKGTLGAARISLETQGLPKFVQSIGDVEFGENFGGYIAGMAGVAVPYMLGIAGAAAGGAVIAGTGVAGLAVGLAAPVWVYSGEVYNNMEGGMDEKNAAAAIAGGLAMAVVDRLALGGIIKPSAMLKKDGFKQLEKHLTKKYVKEAEAAAIKRGGVLPKGELARRTEAATRRARQEIAEAQLAEGRVLIKGLMGEADLAINKGLLASEIGFGVLRGSAIESTTEVFQEGTGNIAAVLGSNKEWNQAEFLDIITNAAAGGALLGGGISGATTGASSYGGAKKLRSDYSLAAKRADENFFEGDTHSNLESLIDSELEGDTAYETDKDIVEARKSATWKEKGVWKSLKELPGLALRKHGSILQSKYMNNPNVPDAGKKALATLLDVFAPGSDSHMAGKDYAASKRDLTEGLKRDGVVIKGFLLRTLGLTKGKKNDLKAADSFQRYVKAKKNGDSLAEWKGIEAQMEAIYKRTTKLTDTLRNVVEKTTGEKIGYVDDWFFASAKLDTQAVMKNKGSFIKVLMEDYGYDTKKAEDFYEQVVHGAGAQEGSQDPVMRGDKETGSVHERTAKFAENAKMQEFLHQDHFAKLNDNIESMIDYAMATKYLGKHDEKLNRAIQATKKAMGDSWDPEIAMVIKDSVDTTRGEYRKLKNKKLKDAQDNLTFFNTLTQLDTSMLASLPELALVLVSAPQKGGLVKIIRDAMLPVLKHYREAAKETGRHVITSKIPSVSDINPSVADMNLHSLSFYNTGYDAGASGVLGALDVDQSAYKQNKIKQDILEAFFRLNGLKILTDGSRVARLAIANDAIFADFETIQGFYSSTSGNSNLANDAFDRMRELNINPVAMANNYKAIVDEISALDPSADVFEYIYENHQGFYNQMEIARTSYVDNALARPTSVDRPLWYSNPHFRLLTQYQGFLSTFTSHIIPKLYKRAKKADPTVQYQAFAVAATMLALAMLGQEGKDQWKYGESTPYITDPIKKGQRVLNASGLTGTVGRVIDFVHPIYSNGAGYNQTAFDQIGNFAGHVTDEAGPFVGTIKNVAKVGMNLINGDKSRSALYGGEQFIPIVGRAKATKDFFGGN